MARKREHLLDLLTDLPWWVSVISAAAAYLGLSFVFPMIATEGVLAKSLGKAALTIAPWFSLPFLLPIPFSLAKAWTRGRVLDTQRDLSTTRTLSWSDFELLVGELFRRQGYVVQERGGRGPDGGVDLFLRKDGQKTIVQCKHWKAQQIGASVVRELLGAMVAERANKGILVSSGRFTTEALEFARGKAIEMMDGEALNALVPIARKNLDKKLSPSRSESARAPGTCPKCSSEMVRRVAKQGANAGEAFWDARRFRSVVEHSRSSRPNL